MKYILFVITLIYSTLQFGCDSTAPQTEYSIQDIMPLASGNQWTWISSHYTSAGSLEREDTIGDFIGAPHTFDGNSGYYPTSCGCAYGFLHYSGNDLLVYDSISKTSSIKLRYPMAPDESIIVVDSINREGLRLQGVLRMLSKNASVTVPAGTFNCVKYEELYRYGADGFLDTAYIIYKYYAPGVGAVMGEQYKYFPTDTPPHIEYSSKLLSYTLN